MPKWISGQELLTRWNIKGIELLEYVNEGLQPHTLAGRPIPPPDALEELTELEPWKKRIEELKRLCKLSDSRSIVKYRQLTAKEDYRNEIKALEEKVKNLETKLSKGNSYSWENFQPADSEAATALIINSLVDSLFELSDAMAFEKEHATGQEDKTDSEIIDLIKAVKPELEKMYKAIKKVGFSGRLPDAEDQWRQAALNMLQRNKKEFTLLTKEDLMDKEIYVLTSGQERRDFVGKTLRKIVERHGLGPIGYQRLYEIYRSTNRLNTD